MAQGSPHQLGAGLGPRAALLCDCRRFPAHSSMEPGQDIAWHRPLLSDQGQHPREWLGRFRLDVRKRFPHPEGGQALEQCPRDWSQTQSSQGRHGIVGVPVQGQERDSMVPEGLFQLRIFCESVILRNGDSMLRGWALELVEASFRSPDLCRVGVCSPGKELCFPQHLSWIIPDLAG